MPMEMHKCCIPATSGNKWFLLVDNSAFLCNNYHTD
jgi:hypothetical protein